MWNGPVQVIVGPRENGVVEYGRDLASAVQELDSEASVASAEDLPGVRAIARRAERIHLHISDRVFGTSAMDSADAVESLAQLTAVTVTLHDLPQTSDGAVNLVRRTDAYRRIVAAARGCVVGSRHEADIFAENLGRDLGSPLVVPLGVRPGRIVSARLPERTAGEVAIAGYFYPGKGHREVIQALAEMREDGSPTRLTGLGAVSEGHEGDYRNLAGEARSVGIEFSMTGYLDRGEYRDRLVEAAVPVAAHQHMSASRSILDWIEAGRRPLVPDTAYIRELAALRPGVLTVYGHGELRDAIGRAFADPDSTGLEPGTDLGYSLDDAAAAYVRWWSNDVSW
ncbi:hypothetical protein BH09ACT1_BH09ACT1_21620 [soil metagenome]